MGTKHYVDLSASPRLPFDEAEVVKHEGKGIVELELREDDNLYIDDKKVVLHLPERQLGDKQNTAREAYQELELGELVVLNSNVLDYIYENPKLFPEQYRKDEPSETLFIFFRGSIFRFPSSDRMCVRCLFWSGGRLIRDYCRLDYGWGRIYSYPNIAN